MTIFITISRGSIARNLLHNKFYDLIKNDFDKVVILTPCSKDRRFINEFKARNVEILSLPDSERTFFDNLIFGVNKFLVYTSNTKVMSTYIESLGKSGIRMFFKHIKHFLIAFILKPLSKIKIFRKFLQYLDFLFFEKKRVAEYQKIIKKYKPSIIFSTNIMEESALLKAARKEKIFSVAMAKSWDNFSKTYFRAKAVKLMVWSKFMSKQAQKLQDYTRDKIEIFGIPQFDYYLDKSRIVSRDNFCKKIGLDPLKKIILFGSEGKYTPSDTDIVKVLLDFIKDGKLADKCQLLIRPHFGYKDDNLKFQDFYNEKNVSVDLFNNPSNCFRDMWDYSKEHMDNFLNSLYHCDFLINTASTLTLDGIAMNKPVILIKFDGYEKRSFHSSVARWYLADYYKAILKSNATIEADSVNGLKDAVNLVLKNPEILKKERERLLEYFCHKIDGRSGERLFNFISKLKTFKS